MQSQRNITLIIILALMWGPSLMFMKIAGFEIPPITLISCRIGIGALILLSVVTALKIRLPKSPKLWLHGAVYGFFSAAFPFTVFAFAMNQIDSVIGALTMGATPIITALMAHFLIDKEKLNVYTGFGIALGFSGLLTLVMPTILDGEISTDTYAILGCCIASLSYAVGIIYSKKFLSNLPRLTAPTMQLTTGALYLIPLALFIETPWLISAPSSTAIWSVIGLGLPGTALPFMLYFYIMEKCGATSLSTFAYILPIVSIMFGVVFLDEVITWNFMVATILILFGMLQVNGAINLLGFAKPKYNPNITE